MRNINRLTFTLLCVFILTVGFAVASLRGANQNSAEQNIKQSPLERERQSKRNFPVADFDAPEETDPTKKRERQGKSKRYDDSGFVAKESSPDATETVFHTAWYEDVPPLPVSQSSTVVTGVVVSSEAHLSNDKSGIYTEFVVEVNEVLKSENGHVAAGSKIGIDRPGGLVRYPGGHKRLYRFSQMNMPAVGREYIFFLKAPEQFQNYDLLTAYELSPQGVIPLDSVHSFQKYQGTDKAAFLDMVRGAIRDSRE
jgi:hypothetical protein